MDSSFPQPYFDRWPIHPNDLKVADFMAVMRNHYLLNHFVVKIVCMGPKVKRKAAEVAAKMARVRFSKRSVLLDGKNIVEEMQDFLSGPLSRGRNAAGESEITRRPEDLKMKIRSPRDVVLMTKREKTELVDRKTPLFGKIPKKNVTSRTNIYRAMRMLKHIIESSKNEIDSRDVVLEKIEEINARLYEKQNKISRKELSEILAELNGIGAMLRKKTSACKRLALYMLEDSDVMLSDFNEARKNLHSGRALNVSRACTKLTAFRRRYGEWRDMQAGKIMAYNYLRACSLRIFRDIELKESMRKLARRLYPKQKSAFVHAAKLTVSKRIYEALRKAEAAFEKRNVKAGRGALYEAANVFSRTKVKDKKTETKIKNLIDSEKFSRKELEYLKNLIASVGWGMPWYVADELEKTCEPYMENCIERLRSASGLMEGRKPRRASEMLYKAIDSIPGPF